MPDEMIKPWQTLQQVIAAEKADDLRALLDRLGAAETARSISRLAQEDQKKLLTLLDPAAAAFVVEEVPEAQAVDLIEDLSPKQAAAIMDEMVSDRQVDVLGDLDEEDAEAILCEMAPEEAADVRHLMTYAPDTAGGIMVTECLIFDQNQTVESLVHDLQANREKYADYDVQYAYVTGAHHGLVGVLRMRDLLFAPRTGTLHDVMIDTPLSVHTGATLEQLDQFFDEHHLFGVPVVGDQDRILGIVQRAAVEEATTKRANRQFLGISGIIRGEEFRSMPLFLRTGRRLSWLSINIVLNIIAASVIAIHQDTLQAAIVLAVFLPMISDMSGCSGNQAVAVSLRELTLGLVRPQEILHVFLKEASIGILNGLILGVLIGSVAILWKHNPYLGLVVGTALAANTIVAVSLGGLLPLFLKRLRLDPALVSGPILTTVTDMCGFFLVLSIAKAVLPHLG